MDRFAIVSIHRASVPDAALGSRRRRGKRSLRELGRDRQADYIPAVPPCLRSDDFAPSFDPLIWVFVGNPPLKIPGRHKPSPQGARRCWVGVS